MKSLTLTVAFSIFASGLHCARTVFISGVPTWDMNLFLTHSRNRKRVFVIRVAISKISTWFSIIITAAKFLDFSCRVFPTAVTFVLKAFPRNPSCVSNLQDQLPGRQLTHPIGFTWRNSRDVSTKKRASCTNKV